MPIKNRIANYQNEMIKWRHHFHENPELAYEEVNTSKKVVSLLKQFGISKIEEGIGKTGVVATLEIWDEGIIRDEIHTPSTRKLTQHPRPPKGRGGTTLLECQHFRFDCPCATLTSPLNTGEPRAN